MLFLVSLALISLLGTGVGIGIFIERTAWNRLIEQGKLPRPGQHY